MREGRLLSTKLDACIRLPPRGTARHSVEGVVRPSQRHGYVPEGTTVIALPVVVGFDPIVSSVPAASHFLFSEFVFVPSDFPCKPV